MEQISVPKAQSKVSASKTATKQARKVATQDAQRKMLQKSNKRTARAAAAAAKKLAEAAAKTVKELISVLASLGGGTALFVVFSIVIVAGAFLASPLGILFADKQQTEDTVLLATAIAEIQGEYHAELERLQNGDFASIQIVGQAPDWREVVAVFASKVAGAKDGMDVFTLDEERVELLRQVFWDILYLESEKHTVHVYMLCGNFEQYSCYSSLQSFEEKLQPLGFLRIQKSYLVNMRHIKKLQCNEVVIENGLKLPVSEKNYKEIKRAYLLWKGAQTWNT